MNADLAVRDNDKRGSCQPSSQSSFISVFRPNDASFATQDPPNESQLLQSGRWPGQRRRSVRPFDPGGKLRSVTNEMIELRGARGHHLQRVGACQTPSTIAISCSAANGPILMLSVLAIRASGCLNEHPNHYTFPLRPRSLVPACAYGIILKVTCRTRFYRYNDARSSVSISNRYLVRSMAVNADHAADVASHDGAIFIRCSRSKFGL